MTFLEKLLASKKALAAGVAAALCVAGGTAYYISIPKLSDVEKYKDKNDVANMTKLVVKTMTSGDKYEDVRTSAIQALGEMKDEKGNEFLLDYVTKAETSDSLKKEILDELAKDDPEYIKSKEDKLTEYAAQNSTSQEVRKAVVEASMASDPKYLRNLANTYIDEAKFDKDENERIYRNLLCFAVNDEARDYLSGRVAEHLVFSLTDEPDSDLAKIKLINKLGLKSVPYADKVEQYAALINEMKDFDKKRTEKLSQIDEKIKAKQDRRNVLELQFRRENIEAYNYAFVLKMQRIERTQGIQAASEYHEQETKRWMDMLGEYMSIDNVINQLGEEKQSIVAGINKEFNDLRARKDRVFYGGIKIPASKNQDMPIIFKLLKGSWYDENGQVACVIDRNEFTVDGKKVVEAHPAGGGLIEFTAKCIVDDNGNTYPLDIIVDRRGDTHFIHISDRHEIYQNTPDIKYYESIGRIYLQMPRSEVEKIYGQPSSVEKSKNSDSRETVIYNNIDCKVEYYCNRVASVTLMKGSKLHFGKSGLDRESSDAEFMRAYNLRGDKIRFNLPEVISPGEALFFLENGDVELSNITSP